MNKKSIENAEHYVWGNNCDAWHLLKSGKLSAIRERMPSGTSEQLHYHQFAQQFFYIFSGTATFEINGLTETLVADESIHIPEKTLHKIANIHGEDLNFLLVSEPDAHGDRIEILDFSEDLKEPIRLLNTEWLEKYFQVEPIDELLLSNPQAEIIDKQGMIFYAKWNSEIVGTASLLKVENQVYELAKMAVADKAQGQGIGRALMEHIMNVAKRNNIRKLILYSNTRLETAIHLYKIFGFTEIYLEQGQYDRANIKMEKIM